MELMAVVVFVLGLVGWSILRRHLILEKHLQLRRMLHDERMKAMERSVELPEAHDIDLARLLGGSQGPLSNGRGGLSSSMAWVRVVSLCLGLTAFLGGIGACVALSMTTAEGLHLYWAMGLIPVFIGVGLLIFYGMSAKLAAQAKDEKAASE